MTDDIGTMDTEAHLQLAHRIHLLLRRELGQGIDVQRLLAEPLYARDVLLVCDALTATELAGLAQQFRAAGPAAESAATPLDVDGARPSAWSHDSGSYAASEPPLADADLPMPPGASRTLSRSWLSASRWLGRD